MAGPGINYIQSQSPGLFGSLLYIDFDPETTAWIKARTSTLYDASGNVDFNGAAVLGRWMEDASVLFGIGIRSMLGMDSTYRLNPGYAAVKAANPYKAHIEGKDPDQPLILTGTLYSAIRVVVQSFYGLEVVIAPTNVPQTAKFVQFKRVPYKKAGLFQFTGPGGETHQTQLRVATGGGRRFNSRKPRSTAINVHDVAEYGAEWEMKTHFIMNGIRKALPGVEERLVDLVDDAVMRSLGIQTKGMTYNQKFMPGDQAASRLFEAFPHGVPDYIANMARG